MRSHRSKAVAATRAQWAAIFIFVAASVPAVGLLVDPFSPARDLANERIPGGLFSAFLAGVAVILVQARVAQDGWYGVCAFPPVTRMGPSTTRWVRVAVQCLHWSAMAVVILTITRRLEFHLGVVLSLGFLLTWNALFAATWVALGYEQTVPKGLRFFFAPDKMWMLPRLRGRIYRGERTCVAALLDRTLPDRDRLLAIELIALRPWVEGARHAVEAVAAEPDDSSALAARARELLATEFASTREFGQEYAA